jgi:hypothetical protein
MIKQGSRWSGHEGKEFVVIHRIELEGKVWIHYRDANAQEYSCYEEAFLARFRECANEKR